jgi:sterol desaturase/sphingolipid hydroxylase (fatty acid hydroxylase superfamily)
LRWLIVTPDMHRIHHGAERREYMSNFGFNLPWWDRALGTYLARPRLGTTAMTIGLPQPRDPAVCANLWTMLAMPFRDDDRTMRATNNATSENEPRVRKRRLVRNGEFIIS